MPPIFGKNCNVRLGQTGLEYSLAYLLGPLIGDISEESMDPLSSTEEYVLKKANSDLIAYQTKLRTKLGRNIDDIEDALCFPFRTIFRTQGDLTRLKDITMEYGELADLASTAIASISILVNYPHVTRWLTDKLPSSNKDEEAKKEKLHGNHLLLTFVLRQMLARLLFQTRLNVALYLAVRKYVEFPGSTIAYANTASQNPEDETHGWYCMVGFNRAYSPNNEIGMAPSSDLDFKVVLDTDKFKMDSNKKLDKKAEKALIEVIVEALAFEKNCYFDSKAMLFLEVEKFTVKTLNGFASDVAKIPTEKNFASSIYRNNTLVTGNKTVYNSFQDVLTEVFRGNLSDVAKNTHKQYLGATDKGSIEIIQKLPVMKLAINQMADIVVNYINPRKVAFEKETHSKWWTETDQLGQQKRLILASNPHVVKWLFGLLEEEQKEQKKQKNGAYDDFIKELEKRALDPRAETLNQFGPVATTYDGIFGPAATQNLYTALQTAPYPDKHPVTRLKLYVKLLASLITKHYLHMWDGKNFQGSRGKIALGNIQELIQDEQTENFIPQHYVSGFDQAQLRLIGSPFVKMDVSDLANSWRFSLKYGLCRVADFFDSVQVEDFEA